MLLSVHQIQNQSSFNFYVVCWTWFLAYSRDGNLDIYKVINSFLKSSYPNHSQNFAVVVMLKEEVGEVEKTEVWIVQDTI